MVNIVTVPTLSPRLGTTPLVSVKVMVALKPLPYSVAALLRNDKGGLDFPKPEVRCPKSTTNTPYHYVFHRPLLPLPLCHHRWNATPRNECIVQT